MKTFSLKQGDVKRDWVVIDASQAPLGRVATAAANHLIGKHRPDYTPHIDSGDFVIIINSSKVNVTGRKAEQKHYYSHSGRPGSLKDETLSDKILRDSNSVLEAAVKGMLPKNKLQDGRQARLKVFTGENHPHIAQQPIVIDLTGQEK